MEDKSSNSVSDIIYPECHLNSPLVTGKLIELIYYTGLPTNQTIQDSTLSKNLKYNFSKARRSYTYDLQNKLGNAVREVYPNTKKLKPVEYPRGNSYLFRIKSSILINNLSNLMSYANTCYNKISNRIMNLRINTSRKLGLTKENYLNGEKNRKEMNSIKNLPSIMTNIKWYDTFLYWFTIKTEMRDLIKGSRKDFKQNQSTYIRHDLEEHVIFLNRNLVIIIQYQSLCIYYLTFEHILMLCDVLEGRLMISLGMESDYRFKQLLEKGYKLWDFIDSQFDDLGNKNYDLVAMIEPLVLGFLQIRDETNILAGSFLDYALHEVKQIYTEMEITDTEQISLIMDIITDIFDIDDIHMISEFFSFFRTFGHPTLEATNAAEKVRSHMNKPKMIKFITMMKGHAIFCGIIINGFRDRHGGAWPPLELPDHASERIKQARNNSEGLTDDLCIRFWQSFAGLKFKCFMPLTLDEDLTMYMKDKALSALRSEWDSVYPRETLRYDPPKSTSSRRLVEVFLEDRNFDPINLINYVLSGDYLEDNEFNISYSLKEKEIKQVGRLFAKMTYKMRACQVVAESLIATGIGKYFKENGMAKNEHELLKTLHKLSVSSVPKNHKINNTNSSNSRVVLKNNHRLYNNTKNKNNLAKIESDYKTNEQYETVSTFLTTDLQKFCLNWRQETTSLFAERLNEIYGLPGFFNWQHKILEKSVLYVADPYCPPYNNKHIDLNEVENQQIFIKYPMGGIEGYSQKLWTIITIPFLFLSAYEIGIKIAAVVQGDNQAIAITTRVHPNLPYNQKKHMAAITAQNYFYKLRSNLGDIGHNLKANETVVSSHFFVYSKRIYYDGLVLSQSLKPLSRVVFWSETLVDETRSACSNISTAISKSIEQGFSRWIGYSINILKILQQLIISLKFTINENLTPDITTPIYQNPYWLICAALVPSQIGGYNYMNISRLFVRNIGDPVTASLADLKRLIEAGLVNESLLQKVMHQKPGTSTYLDWASDPYSINIPNSQSVTTVLKNITSRTILQNSENPMLAGLFHFEFEKEDQDLAEFLLNRPVIIPRAAHEIMDKSLTGARQEIAGMLDTTKGLIRNSIKAGGINPGLITKLALYDYEQFRVFNNLMSVKMSDPLITINACSVKLAITLRKRMWKDLAHGRKIYGLEVPDSIEVINGYFVKECEDCYYCSANQNQYGWFFCPAECQLDDVHQESNSLRVPYFGSTTDERSEIKLSSVRNTSRALKSAIRIATVYTWAFGDTEENWNEAWYLSSFRANITLEELKAITPISTSNNIAHRLRDKSTQMKYASTALNRVGRYVTISNDSLNFQIEGRKIDTNLVYQQVMLTGLSVLEERFRFSSTTGQKNTVLHLHIQSNCCVIEMEDHPYIESKQILPILHGVQANRLVYDDDPIIEKERNLIMQQVYKSGTLDFPRWDLCDLNEALSKSLALTIIEVITKETKDHLSEFKTLSSDDDINSLITEFLLVDPESFSLNLGLCIAINWSYDIYYRRPEGKYQMLEYLNSILLSSSHSLMIILANAFSHPKVFQRFWDNGLVEPIYGPNLSSQDFTKIAIDFLINSYHQYLNYWLSGESTPYILTEGDEDIIEQRYEVLQAKHLCMLSSLYLDRDRMPKILNLTSIEKCAILTERLRTEQFKNGIFADWKLDELEVINYPSSLTYIRRGSIKHIRLRSILSSESIGFDKFLMERHPVRSFQPNLITGLDLETNSHFFPIMAIFGSDYKQLMQESWNQEDSNYWENHVTRRVGINSTSSYKALEIAHYLEDKIEKRGSRLYLGEGSGAMMILYHSLWGPARTYYNTGVFNTEVIGQRILSVTPAEALMVEKNNTSDLEFSNCLNTLFNGKPESTWIGSDESFTYIMSQINPHTLEFIHNDMESTREKDSYIILQEQIYSLTLALNLGSRSSIYVTKIAPYVSDYTSQLIMLMTEYYEEVFGFIPYSSNPYSSELYIILSYPKMSGIYSPNTLLSRINVDHSDHAIDIGMIIRNFKIRYHIDRSYELGRYDDYSSSDLINLTKPEKLLLSVGFSLNGPKIVKQLIGHDPGSGEEILKASIQTLLNNLLVASDSERETSTFFDPYPIKQDSKLREITYSIARKLTGYMILYGKGRYRDYRKRAINNIRRKIIFLDWNNYDVCSIFNKSMMTKFNKSGLKDTVMLRLETVEIKMWWKVVGYSLLLD
ncbi:RNA polymerase [Wufeng Rhinolophus pearsonii paramyxovirus 1]|uniref:RNA-directed RNA polymerase L n=1 Tax=Wufeng Rhinolophus pearsonii paramyxovirus 1 TaxID=2877502 RepID=A0AAE8XSC0_9MONO|nr:RNA polymerase [Wufeng Rhinolophus pearsonii paramyxovirus 1]